MALFRIAFVCLVVGIGVTDFATQQYGWALFNFVLMFLYVSTWRTREET